MNRASALVDAFRHAGIACVAHSGAPLPVSGTAAWLAETRPVDLFLVRVRDGDRPGALNPVCRVEAGHVLWGMPHAVPGWELVAIGGPDSRLLRLDGDTLRALATDRDTASDLSAAAEISAAAVHWAALLTATLAGAPPRQTGALTAGSRVSAQAGEAFTASEAGLWTVVEDGAAHLLGRKEMPLPVGLSLPIPHHAWLAVSAPATLRTAEGESAWQGNDVWRGWEHLLGLLFSGLAARAEEAEERQRARLRRKAAKETRHIGDAMGSLAEALTPRAAPPVVRAATPLLAACRIIGAAAGMVFESPPDIGKDVPGRDPLREIAEASRLRYRGVALKGRWWEADHGPLLAHREDGGQPVALLRGRRGYTLHDPRQGTEIPVDEAIAATLRPFGVMFYRSFGDTVVGTADMLRFAARGNLRDYATILAMSVALGLIGLVAPLVTGTMFDTVIPGAERGQLAQLTLALMAGAFASAMFEVTRGFAMLRAEGRMDASVQAAIWDRLLRLPMPFFRDYSAGDLALRANGISTIRQTLSGNALHSLLSALFSLFYLVLLFYYSVKLALLALALVAAAVAFTVTASVYNLRHERRRAEFEGQVSGLVFQLLGGVAKLRTSGAERRAFLNWAALFAREEKALLKGHMVRGVRETFNAVFPVVSSMAIFAVVAFYMNADQQFSTGSFLAFNAAFGSFLGAMLGSAVALTQVLEIIPVYERTKAILGARPEITDAKAHPGELGGEIELSHVSFRYAADGPLILDDVSLSIRRGEFVALVGASGSGKSTLLRLLLGFETPVAGSIYYDRQDLAGIDPGAVRRQLGVVLQNGQLMAGDIFTNIVGSAALTLDDAWKAAEQAGIADDIRAMPMGMHTMVSDGGGTLSGGQRQRLLIARAIVNRPRVLFFDEATSALDNRTQEVVSTSLDALQATRVVIAHRLSTIVNADRIFVLEHGHIVQSGTYDELMECPGPFAELARRQIA